MWGDTRRYGTLTRCKPKNRYWRQSLTWWKCRIFHWPWHRTGLRWSYGYSENEVSWIRYCPRCCTHREYRSKRFRVGDDVTAVAVQYDFIRRKSPQEIERIAKRLHRKMSKKAGATDER